MSYNFRHAVLTPPITNRFAVTPLILYGCVLSLAASTCSPGPDQPSTDRASASLTVTFMVMGLGTTFNALTKPRPASRLVPPILKALGIRMSTS